LVKTKHQIFNTVEVLTIVSY